MKLSVYILVSMSMIPGLLSENNKTSTESVNFRLVGGASRCHGDLEMKKWNGTWKPVNGEFWYRKLGNKVCAELDCGSAVSVKDRHNRSEIDSWWFNPDCDKASLSDCFTSYPAFFSFLELSCSDSVRLVNGSGLCSGRLEVRSNQSSSWSSVCEGHLDLPGAQVVCRQLGCGAPEPLQRVLSEVKAFQCEGHESALLDCGRPGSHNCSSGTALDLTCTDHVDVRLVGGASRCNGEVQIKHHGEWRYMGYYPYYPESWTLKAADVICGQLDCGSAVNVTKGSDDQYHVWFMRPQCLLSTSVLIDCVSENPSFTSPPMSLTCSDSVRLVNGSSLCSGRLEVWSNQSWSSVCEGDLDLNDTQVVCRELGCGAPLFLQGGLYGEGDARVWTSELQCEGNESAILDCRRSNSAGQTCSNGTAAGLTCLDPVSVRVMGQPSRCAGALEIEHQGKWTPVGDTKKKWHLGSGSTMCRHMNCGSAVSVNTTKYSTKRHESSVSVPCVNLTSGLRDCVEIDAPNNSTGVDVACSDLLPQPNISLSDGVYQPYQQGFRVLVYSPFTITCSVQPQYPGGFFQLISHTKEPVNLTLPAVNHSAHFLLSFWGRAHTHQGNYYCIYHLNVYNHNFSSPQSSALYMTTGDLVRNLIIRVMLIVPALLIFDLCIFYFYKVSMRRIQMEADARMMRVWE